MSGETCCNNENHNITSVIHLRMGVRRFLILTVTGTLGVSSSRLAERKKTLNKCYNDYTDEREVACNIDENHCGVLCSMGLLGHVLLGLHKYRCRRRNASGVLEETLSLPMRHALDPISSPCIMPTTMSNTLLTFSLSLESF
jgi:hypothetical protein